jgi:hypothetical protein
MAYNTQISEATKVTMNMSEKTLADLEVIGKLTGNSNRTNIVGTALRVYRKLLELQEKENGKLIIEDKSGKFTRMELVH